MADDEQPAEPQEPPDPPESSEPGEREVSPALAAAEADAIEAEAELAEAGKRIARKIQTDVLPGNESLNRSLRLLQETVRRYSVPSIDPRFAKKLTVTRPDGVHLSWPAPPDLVRPDVFSDEDLGEDEAAKIDHLAEVAQTNRTMASALNYIGDVAQQQLATAVAAEARAKADQRRARWTTLIALVIAGLSLATSIFALLVAKA